MMVPFSFGLGPHRGCQIAPPRKIFKNSVGELCFTIKLNIHNLNNYKFNIVHITVESKLINILSNNTDYVLKYLASTFPRHLQMDHRTWHI